jgi:PAS domain S-box-containing protein
MSAPDEPGYQALFEASPHPMWVYDRETLRFLAVNDAAVARYGWSRAEFLAMTLRDIRPAEEIPALERSLAAETLGIDRAGLFRHFLRDGTPIEVEITSHSVRFAGRDAELVLANDVTEKRRTGELLRWLQRAVEQTETAIFMTAPDGTIRFVNPGFERLYGYTAEQAVGATPRLLKSGEMSDDHYQSLWHTLLAGRNYRGTHVNRTRAGALVTVDASVTPLRGPDDELLGYVAIHQDVTERRRLEEGRERLEAQLAHAQRFEALGTLAAGMAHDFNNLLGVVLGHAALLAQDPDDPERTARAAEALRLAGERGVSLVRRILTFARRSDARFEVVDAWATVAEVERLLVDILPRNIALEVSADPGQAFVWADRGQLQQVLLNLCVNARDAMPSGGSLALRVTRAPGARVRQRCPEAAASEYVELSVTDTGHGMSEQTRHRVFEPFFTTKEPGKGSGLGLSVVYGIVKAHGGSVDVESAQGSGTVFRLYLPLCLAPAPTPPEARPRTGHGTVLLVEDEEMLAEVGRAWLEDAGYDVLVASDGDEAVEMFRAQAGSVDLVVCDLGLPKRGGREVYFALRELAPRVPVILVSGYIEPSERVELARAGVAGFLEKPYREEELLETVTGVRALAGEPSDPPA